MRTEQSSLDMLLPEGAAVRVFSDKGKALKGRLAPGQARVLVREGRAVLYGPNRIQLVWDRRCFSRYILDRDQYRCHYCGRDGATIDHLLPRSKGGRSTPTNCVCACYACNQLKADRTREEFLAWLARRPRRRHRIEGALLAHATPGRRRTHG